jgi:hypothetical protein
MNHQYTRRTLVLAIAVVCCACEDAPHVTAGEPATEVLKIGLVVSGADSLPKCTGALAGTTAYTRAQSKLSTCVSGSWVNVPCANVTGGALAYASREQLVLACVAGSWTQVALPAGATGATGARGPVGPAGSNGTNGKDGADGKDGTDGDTSLLRVIAIAPGAECASGGVRVAAGVDVNGNGQLDDAEVTSSVVVCTPSEVDAGSAADAGVGPLSEEPITEAELASTSSAVKHNTYGIGTPWSDALVVQLSPNAQRTYQESGASAGTAALLRGVSVDALERAWSFRLAYTEGETPYSSAVTKRVDYVATSTAGLAVAVSVTRAGGYTPATGASIRALLEVKLNDLQLARSNIVPFVDVRKALLHVFTDRSSCALQVEEQFAAIDAATRADTLLIVTELLGEGAASVMGGTSECTP